VVEAEEEAEVEVAVVATRTGSPDIIFRELSRGMVRVKPTSLWRYSPIHLGTVIPLQLR